MKTSKNIPIPNLKKLRTANNATQADIAGFLGCTVKTYRNYEKGIEYPKIEYLIALSERYNVSIDYLLGRSDCTAVDNKYIHEKLGLSDKAINRLKQINESDKQLELSNIKNVFRDSSSVSPVMIKLRIPFLNFLLESKRFINLLNDLIYFFDSDRYTTLLDDSFHQIKNSHGLINKSFYPANNDLIAGGPEIRIDSDTHKALAKNLLDIHLMKLSEEFKKKKPS